MSATLNSAEDLPAFVSAHEAQAGVLDVFAAYDNAARVYADLTAPPTEVTVSTNTAIAVPARRR